MDEKTSDIARVEEHIEALHDAIVHCRKVALAAKVMIATGGLWLACTLFGIVDFVPLMLIAAIAAVIGGIVLAGSNATTWTQKEDQLERSEALRAQMIGQIDMRVVGDERPTTH
jgi:hypothetical protein